MRFRFFQIEVTRRCNLSCIMCPSRLFPEKKDMDFKTFLRISEYFDKTDMIHLQGWGEPFMHPDILEMVRIAKEHAKTGLTTNGTMLKKFARGVVSLQMDYIAVSISGPRTQREIRGSTHESVIDGIKHLNEAKREYLRASFHKPHFSHNKDEFPGDSLGFKTRLGSQCRTDLNKS